MNKKGKISSIVIAIALVVCVGTITSSTNNGFRIKMIDSQETYPSAPGSLVVVYDDTNEIIDDASIVVKGSVIGQSIEMLDGFPQTHTEIKIIEVFKGDVQIDSIIEVIEEGGGNGQVMGGIPYLSNEFEYYLMLTEYNDNYYICGAFQGRFVEREGYVYQQATEDTKITRDMPLSTTEFEIMINNYINN